MNLGSGPRGLDAPNWLNVDAFPDKNVHYLLDFNRPLPFKAETFDGVFCEHVLEHFSFEDGVSVMTEIQRILKSGGSVRIIVPNAEWLMRSYFDSPDALVSHRGVDGLTPIEVINDYFRQRYEHHFLHDFVSMDKLLRKAGFTTTVRSEFGKSSMMPELVLDDGKYSAESLYVDATKK